MTTPTAGTTTQAPKLLNGSDNSAIDTAMCEATPVRVGSGSGRCGYSQRLPMLVISPYTRDNYVSNNLTDTTSVVKFIEQNWLHGQTHPRLVRRDLGQPGRPRRPARLQHQAALPAADPQPDHRRCRQRRWLGLKHS